MSSPMITFVGNAPPYIPNMVESAPFQTEKKAENYSRLFFFFFALLFLSLPEPEVCNITLYNFASSNITPDLAMPF